MPNHTMTGPYGDDPMLNWRAWVPIDDTNVFVIGMNFHPLRALTEEELERFRDQIRGMDDQSAHAQAGNFRAVWRLAGDSESRQ